MKAIINSSFKFSTLLAAWVLMVQSSHAAGQNQDINAITSKMQQWVDAWNIGTKPFDATRFETLFMPGENAISVFDNVQGDVLTLSSVDEYMTTWVPFMEPLPVWSVDLRDFNVSVSGDMAYTTFRLVGTDTQGPNGEQFPFGQYGTHVWKKVQNEWFIIHEHLTAYDISNPVHEK